MKASTNMLRITSTPYNLKSQCGLLVCGGLRAHQGGQLQEEGGAGWGGGPDRHPGHGGPGGLRRHQGQLLPQRRGLPLRLLHHRAGVVRRHRGLQVTEIPVMWALHFFTSVSYVP